MVFSTELLEDAEELMVCLVGEPDELVKCTENDNLKKVVYDKNNELNDAEECQ